MSGMNWARSQQQVRMRDRGHERAKLAERTHDERPLVRVKFATMVERQSFWAKWRADKQGMRAQGYRVTRSSGGQWIVQRVR
jgi:hypothetical protein